MTVGIAIYGVCIPRYRIKVSEMAKVRNTDVQSIAGGIRMPEKSQQIANQSRLYERRRAVNGRNRTCAHALTGLSSS